MSVPRDHHYLPEFYLRRWVVGDGRLTRFRSVSDTKIDVRRVFPSQIAYKRDLYSLPGLTNNEAAAQVIESSFFQIVDHDAANALEILEGNRPANSWTDGTRSGWSRFVLSLLFRSPRHWTAVVEELRRIDGELAVEMEGQYQELSGSGDPATFDDWIAQRDPQILERGWRKVMVDAIDDPYRGNSLNNLRWFVLDLSRASRCLLTSDNAVILVPIDRNDGHIALPISPTHLFVATKHRPFWHSLSDLCRRSPDAIVKQVNKLTVERADQIVIASDDRQRSFIEKHFGSNRIGTFGVE